MTNHSTNLMAQALKVIPGGVNSPVRAFASVGGNPLFMRNGQGAYVTDVDGQRYVDYVGSWGPLILGHRHPSVIQALQEQLESGLGFGTSTAQEVSIANEIVKLVPSIEQVRLVNSGTEATMSAVRLARAYTERSYIIKFAGCYHGHADCLLVDAGSGPLTLGQPSSPGIPTETTQHTLIAQFNDIDSVAALFALHPNRIAAVIVEPVAGNMNCIPPRTDFLSNLRSLCDHHRSLLIFDEVMTGFRVALGGAQQLYGVSPDLTTLGKVIGGGLPVGAFGGRAEIMSLLAPHGPVYQAGTLSGNPLSVAAGLATLRAIQTPQFYQNLQEYGDQLTSGLKEVGQQAGYKLEAHCVGGLFGFFFTSAAQAPMTLTEVKKCHSTTFSSFYRAALQQGVYFAPSMFEANFLSCAHDADTLAFTLNAVAKALHTMQRFSA